jgi:hypothetical protein
MRYLTLALLLALPAPVAAQTPILPGQLLSFEVDPGVKQAAPNSPNTVPRPEANVVFEFRVDGGAPVAGVKDAPCTLVAPTGVTLTCRLRPPTLTAGAHTIDVRALVSPAEAGVGPSGYSPALSVASIIVTAPGTPSNLRITNPQP